MEIEGLDKKTVKADYPSNSLKQRHGKENAPVINGKVSTKKPPMAKRLANIFIGEDIEDYGQYFIYSVILPSVKDFVWDLITGMFKKNSPRDKKDSRYVSYSSYYETPSRSKRKREESGYRQKSVSSPADLIFEGKDDARAVIEKIYDLIDDYGCMSVADLYDMVNYVGSYRDNKFGWYDVGDIRILNSRDGYMLDLPRPVPLDDGPIDG